MACRMACTNRARILRFPLLVINPLFFYHHHLIIIIIIVLFVSEDYQEESTLLSKGCEDHTDAFQQRMQRRPSSRSLLCPAMPSRLGFSVRRRQSRRRRPT
ncbi:hypothetical protein FRC15_008252 [Serendipita sp. 397]|nr:hypothetical protein FRC15_008252 [Serendipita sp. 397]